MSYIIEKIENVYDSFAELAINQLTCDCEWCKLNIDRCDNDKMKLMLKLTIQSERYELSALIKNILDDRKTKNIVYTDDYKKQINQKLRKCVESKNLKNDK